MGALAWFGVTPFLKVVSNVEQIAGASPSGSTFGTAKYAGVAINAASPGANGTSTSILNTDANDRYPTAIRLGCEGLGTSKTAYTGAGLSALQLSIGTSSTAAPAVIPGTLVSGAAVTIATATPQFELNTVVTSSSLGGAVWPTNTYMTFWLNATNTAACTVGVDYVAG